MKVAKTWVDNCIENHPECNRWATPGWLPTRLLDVGPPGEPNLHLHITTGISTTASYTTLSHSWGQLKIKRLEKATLSAMMNKIDIGELLKTFQDAIAIT